MKCIHVVIVNKSSRKTVVVPFVASHSICIFPAELHLLYHQVGRAAHQMKEWSLRFVKLSITEIKLASFSP